MNQVKKLICYLIIYSSNYFCDVSYLALMLNSCAHFAKIILQYILDINIQAKYTEMFDSFGPVLAHTAQPSGGCTCHQGLLSANTQTSGAEPRCDVWWKRTMCTSAAAGSGYLNDVVTSFDQDGLHLLWRWRGSLWRRGRRGRGRGRGRLSGHHFLLPSSSALSWSGWCRCRLGDDRSPSDLSGRHVERQREPPRKLHHVRVVWLLQLQRRLDGHILLRGDRRGGSRWGRNSHGGGDDGLVGAWDELDLPPLGHHLDGLGALDLRHHLVLDVGGGLGGGARRALLDGEHDGAAGGGGAQAGGQLDHITLCRQEAQVFGRGGGDGGRLYRKEAARLWLHGGSADGSLSGGGANLTTGGSQEGQG